MLAQKIPMFSGKALRPKKSFDFRKGILPAGLTFTRADAQTSATYFDANGVLKTVAANVPRFDYFPNFKKPKLLIEEQATNLRLNSEAFGTWGGTASKTNNVYVAPDGNTTGAQVSFSSNSNIFITQAVTNAVAYTESIFLKYISGSAPNIQIGNDQIASSQGLITINPVTMAVTGAGTSVTSYSATACGNGWFRFTVSWVATSASSSMVIACASPSSLVLGFWGDQLEQKTFATSYIKTSGSALTRARDNCFTTSVGFYNQSKGSFACRFQPREPIVSGTFLWPVSFTDNTSANELGFYINGSSGSIAPICRAGSVTQFDGLGATTCIANQMNKVAVRYGSGNYAASVNGASPTTNASASLPTVSRLQIGAEGSGASAFNGWIEYLNYYDIPLSNAMLRSA